MGGRLRDQYWVKTVKWHLYKKRVGSAEWRCRYRFDGCARRLTTGDIAIDCGANVGTYTRMLARNGATVHAFEPDPYSFARLEEATSHLPNVVCHPKAVGTKHAQVKLFRANDFDEAPETASLSSSVLGDKMNVSSENFVHVEQIDFLDFLESLEEPVRLVKIDIEGAEVPLLEAMIATGVINRVGPIYVETHETRVPRLAERTERLRTLASKEYAETLFLDWA